MKKSPEERALTTRSVWAGRDDATRAAIGQKISKARKGHKVADDVRAKISASLRRDYSGSTREEREARIAAARRASQGPAAKRKRAEALSRWREGNPGARGGSGLTTREKVALFFAAHPGASDYECAAAIGRSVYLVSKHRAPGSRLPWRRDLLARIARRTPAIQIARFFGGSMPKCPKCGALCEQVTTPQKGACAGRTIGRCGGCRRQSFLPAGTRFRRPPIKASALPAQAIFRLLDGAASGWPLSRCYGRADLSVTTGEKVVELILTEFGEHIRDDWRRSNRTRTKEGSHAPTR